MSTASIQDCQMGSPEILNSLHSEAFAVQIFAGYAQKDKVDVSHSEADVAALLSQWWATWLVF